MNRSRSIYPADVPLVDIQTVYEYYVGTDEERRVVPEKECPCNRTPFPEMIVRWKPRVWPEHLICFVIGGPDFVQVTSPIHEAWKGGPNRPTNATMRKVIDEHGAFVDDGMDMGVPVGEMRPPEDWSGWKVAASNFLMVCIGLSFMHVKGARIEAPQHVSRQARRQWERSKQQVKVLRLEPLERVMREHAEAEAQQHRRIHLVRGHFKDFSQGSGVGGNPKARGLYWSPPHIRGDKALGIVAKQYETGRVAG